ncbi:hypothetical protein RU95_GL004010 [Enterococcus avium]|nr:hypothetical protein RU95_GL004010 [Enterococcus avium]
MVIPCACLEKVSAELFLSVKQPSSSGVFLHQSITKSL